MLDDNKIEDYKSWNALGVNIKTGENIPVAIKSAKINDGVLYLGIYTQPDTSMHEMD